MALGYVALMGVGAAVVTGLLFPVALKLSQAMWDRLNSRDKKQDSDHLHPVMPAHHG